MTIKRNYSYVLSLLISVMFVSCWDNFEERTFYSANINKFSFDPQDTCPGIQNFVFNIDQYHGVAADTMGIIQNLDPLPYGSVVNSLYPKVTFQSTNGNIYINDSLWEDGDSIDFTTPVVLKNTSFDGLYTKSYTIYVNVYLVDPDSMHLETSASVLPGNASASKIIETNGVILDYVPSIGGGLQLYRSADSCKTWSSQVVSGLSGDMNLQSLCTFGTKYYITSKTHLSYRSDDGLSWTVISPVTSGGAATVLTLYGQIKKKYISNPVDSTLIGMLITSAGDTCFGKSSDGITWLTKKDMDANADEKIPADFPFSDFALIKDSTATNVHFYTIANGSNALGQPTASVWATEDGLNWTVVNDGKTIFNALPKRKNASLFRYDGYLVSFGGQDESGALYNDLHISPDHGKTWKNADANWAFLKMDSGLAGAGVYVQHVPDLVYDKDREFILILGGTREDGASSTIWKGYLNKMVFARR